MIQSLKEVYTFKNWDTLKENISSGRMDATAHLSICDAPGNIGSEDESRSFLQPRKRKYHKSYYQRKKLKEVPIVIKGVEVKKPYPCCE